MYQIPLAGPAPKDVSKRQLCFSRKKKNLYSEVKKETPLPLNTSLKQEDVVVSIFFFFQNLFFFDAHIRILLLKVQITVVRIDLFFYHWKRDASSMLFCIFILSSSYLCLSNNLIQVPSWGGETIAKEFCLLLAFFSVQFRSYFVWSGGAAWVLGKKEHLLQ